MSRLPKKPCYYASRGGYYCQLNGELECLAKGDKDNPHVRDEAWRKFHVKMARFWTQKVGETLTMLGLVRRYIAWRQANLFPITRGRRLGFLQDFVENPARALLKVRDLEQHHVEDWLGGRRSLRNAMRQEPSSSREAVTAVVVLMNWAKKMGYIAANPVARMSRPPAPSRDTNAAITNAEHALVLRHARRKGNAGYVHLLTAMYETGALPGEIEGVTAGAYDAEAKTWAIGLDGKRRVIHLPSGLAELVERLNAQHPEGPIFRNPAGDAFSVSGVLIRFECYREFINRKYANRGEAKPIRPNVTLYGYRHRFAEDWLFAGRPIDRLATLLGTSVTVLQDRYWFIDPEAKELRKCLEDFTLSRGLPANFKTVRG